MRQGLKTQGKYKNPYDTTKSTKNPEEMVRKYSRDKQNTL